MTAIEIDALDAPAPARRARASTGPSRTADPARRRAPRIIDTDWLVLRGLRRAVEALASGLPLDGRTVLDFGCDTRPYAGVFEGRGATYIGADFSGAEIDISPDGRLDAPDDLADGVVSFQVLEHVRDLGRYFGEAARVLRPGGWMILSTHGSWLYHPHPEDHRRWTRQGLVGDIEAHGFAVEACLPVVGPLAWTTMLRLTCACYALRRAPVAGPLACALLSIVSNARAWVEDRVTPAWVTRDNACVYVVLARRA